MPKQSSGHFAPAGGNSEDHNQRKELERDYLLKNDTTIPDNVSIVKQSIESRLEEIKELYATNILSKNGKPMKWQDQPEIIDTLEQNRQRRLKR